MRLVSSVTWLKNRPALGHQIADLALGVHHGRVIAVAEGLPDLRQRQVGQLPAQVHRDLPRGDQHPAAGGSAELLHGDREVFGGRGHDRRGADRRLLGLRDEVLEHDLASARSTPVRLRLANAVTRIRAPSSSRMLL